MKTYRYLFLAVVALAIFAIPANAQTVTRFPNGITNVGNNDPFSLLPSLDPTRTFQYFEDFIVGGAAPDNINFATGGADTYKNWTVTKTGTPTITVYGAAYVAGSGAITSASWGIASASGSAGGVLCLTNSATDNDATSLQLATFPFSIKTGKELWFEAKINFASSTTQSDFLVGLCSVDTTPLTALDSGIYFAKDDGDAYLDFEKASGANVSAATAITSVSASTWYTLSFHYDGASAVDYWVNGTHLGTANTTFLPTTAMLAPTIHIQDGEASLTNAIIDYILAIEER